MCAGAIQYIVYKRPNHMIFAADKNCWRPECRVVSAYMCSSRTVFMCVSACRVAVNISVDLLCARALKNTPPPHLKSRIALPLGFSLRPLPTPARRSAAHTHTHNRPYTNMCSAIQFRCDIHRRHVPFCPWRARRPRNGIGVEAKKVPH